MPNANQILPFATGGGANVLTPADYADLPARTAGFVAGVANSQQLNTVWRQASFVAAMVAQFTADYGPSDVQDDGDLATLEAQFVEALKSFIPENSLLHYGVAAGTANAITGTFTPTITSLVAGITLLVKITTTNTAGVTINPNSLGAKTVYRPDGTALQYGDLEAGGVGIMIYDGTQFMLAGTLYKDNFLDHWGLDTGVKNALVVPVLDPPLLNLKAGTTIRTKVAVSNDGSSTLNAGGFGVKNIKLPAGTPLAGGELIANAIATFTYDGTQFWLQTAQAVVTSNSSGGLTAVATESPIHGDGTVGSPVHINAATTSGDGAVQLADAAVYQSNSHNRALAVQEVWEAAAFIDVAYGATVTLDMAAGFNWNIGPLTGPMTLANPSNLKSGQEGLIVFTQDATGGRALTLGSKWKTAGGFEGLSEGPDAIDAIAYKVVSTDLIIYSLLKGCV